MFPSIKLEGEEVGTARTRCPEINAPVLVVLKVFEPVAPAERSTDEFEEIK
jgi:hypothetical protein